MKTDLNVDRFLVSKETVLLRRWDSETKIWLNSHRERFRKLVFMFQIAAHTDPISGDCEETEAYCPLKQIGCSETKVWFFFILYTK